MLKVTGEEDIICESKENNKIKRKKSSTNLVFSLSFFSFWNHRIITWLWILLILLLTKSVAKCFFVLFCFKPNILTLVSCCPKRRKKFYAKSEKRYLFAWKECNRKKEKKSINKMWLCLTLMLILYHFFFRFHWLLKKCASFFLSFLSCSDFSQDEESTKKRPSSFCVFMYLESDSIAYAVVQFV